jgi:hypothetical protein
MGDRVGGKTMDAIFGFDPGIKADLRPLIEEKVTGDIKNAMCLRQDYHVML